MHRFLKFISGIDIYMFRAGFLPIISSPILIPLASSQHNLYDICLLLCVQY
jgi:hypothetical protein